MTHRIRLLLFAAGLGLMTSPSIHAFSLLGPYENWMQNPNGFRQPTDIGGPMNLGEEYRWNVPVLTYAFDPSFLDYFGSNGVYAVEQAIQILNNLPPASQIAPSNFPPEVTQINATAQSAGLLDVKSMTLFLLLEQLGLAQPTRFAFCVHDFNFTGGPLNATVVQRNFDPTTLAISSYVNDTLLDYQLYQSSSAQGTNVDALEFAVDPLSPMFPAVADRNLGPGMLYPGLTRDDVGGLRYLLRTNNYNLEILLPGVHGIGTNSGNYASTALRPGVDKTTFVRRDYDGLLGQFFSPYTNQYTDVYVTNNTRVQQQLERVSTQPDIVFRSGDNGSGTQWTPEVLRTGTTNWWNSSQLGAAGPGIIRPPIQLTFHRLGPTIVTDDNAPEGFFHVSNRRWGSFDVSANPPVAYPSVTGGDSPPLTINLRLYSGGNVASESYTWQIPLSLGDSVSLQTSTNLSSWTALTSVTNQGVSVEWEHFRSRLQRFFRIVPE